MVEWDFVAVVLAAITLPFVVYPRLASLLLSKIRQLTTSHQRQQHRCERLFWDDITSDGPLHECRAVPCNHDLSHHRPGNRCWESSFSIAFNTVWNKAQRRHVFVKKPAGLALDREYLAVDLRVLLAYICTAVDPLDWFMWVPYVKSFTDGDPGDFLTLEFNGKITTAHVVESGFQPTTKRALETIFTGAPPIYREKIRIAHTGQEVAYPYSGPEDSRRGGWIIAYGIMCANDTEGNNLPNPFYFEKHAHLSDHRMPSFALAMARVYDILKGPFTEVFPGDKNLAAALAVYESFANGGRHIWGELDGSDIRLHPSPASSLDGDQALKAIAMFNQAPKFTRAQLVDLKRDAGPILVPILAAAVHGVWSVRGDVEGNVVNMGAYVGNLKLHSRVFITGCSSDMETS